MHRHRFGDSCTHSPLTVCTAHHDTLCIALFVAISNVVALSSAALMISGKLIWLTCQIRKCSITVTRSCWLSLKSFQTLHGLSRWRTKQAILLSKPTAYMRWSCTVMIFNSRSDSWTRSGVADLLLIRWCDWSIQIFKRLLLYTKINRKCTGRTICTCDENVVHISKRMLTQV